MRFTLTLVAKTPYSTPVLCVPVAMAPPKVTSDKVDILWLSTRQWKVRFNSSRKDANDTNMVSCLVNNSCSVRYYDSWTTCTSGDSYNDYVVTTDIVKEPGLKMVFTIWLGNAQIRRLTSQGCYNKKNPTYSGTPSPYFLSWLSNSCKVMPACVVTCCFSLLTYATKENNHVKIFSNLVIWNQVLRWVSGYTNLVLSGVDM